MGYQMNRRVGLLARCTPGRGDAGGVSIAEGGADPVCTGHISVVNRPGLEKRSCECYAVVKKEYDRMLEDKPAAQFHAMPSDRDVSRVKRAAAALTAQPCPVTMVTPPKFAAGESGA